MDSSDADGLIRVAEWALSRFGERQIAAATGVVVLVYFRGEMRELIRTLFARRDSVRKRLSKIEETMAEARKQLAELERASETHALAMERHAAQLDILVVQLGAKGPPGRTR